MDIVRVEFPPALMTREMAAYYIGGTLADIDLLKRQHEITPVGTQKRIKYRKTDLDRYVEQLPERPSARH
ncbi:MAG: hypothetical protein WED09_11885 [Homoserinimonas sp.]